MSDQIQKLCEQARTGDLAAATELVNLTYQRIFCYFRRLCHLEDVAADLTQKTYAKVWSALPSFAGRSSFSTWLHGIAHHVYVDWRRKPSRQVGQTDEWWRAQLSDGPSPWEDVAEKDLAECLYHQVERLNEPTREVVHLHYYQGLTLVETAEALGVAVSTVKYRLREALDYLRHRLRDEPRPKPLTISQTSCQPKF